MPGPAAMLLLICLSLLFPLAACAGEDPALLEDSQVAEEPTSIPTLLSEDAASSILRDFLIDCIASWDVVYESSSLPSPYGRKFERGGPVPTGEAREWWEALARQPVSSRYAGITDKTDVRNREEHLETWVVIGPGLTREGGGLQVIQGTWRVYAGQRIAEPLDGPARVALEEFKRPLDLSFDRDCSGYLGN